MLPPIIRGNRLRACQGFTRLDRNKVRYGELAFRWTEMEMRLEVGKQVVFNIAFFADAHGCSMGTVAYLKGARLERNLGSRRRERKTDYCFKHTPTKACVPTAFPFV